MPTALSIRREHRTQSLLSSLVQETDPSLRAAITAEVVELNLGVCDAVANRFLHRGVERDDLVQVARLALVMAVGRFRLEAERPFLSFAVPTITGELKRYFRDHCWMIRPPRSIQESRARLDQVGRALEQELGRPPKISELAAATRQARQEVAESLSAGGGYRPLSLEAPLDGRSAQATVGDVLPADDDQLESLPERLALRESLASLRPIDRMVVHWRFAEECSQSEIAKRLGGSQMQVSRMLRRIPGQLRESVGS